MQSAKSTGKQTQPRRVGEADKNPSPTSASETGQPHTRKAGCHNRMHVSSTLPSGPLGREVESGTLPQGH